MIDCGESFFDKADSAINVGNDMTCLDKLLSFESRNSNTQKQFAKLREIMNKFIAEKIAE